MKWLGLIILSVVSFGLFGCADDQAVQLGPQNWNDLQIIVEARPTPIRSGMTEFIVIASREKVKPGFGLIVSMRVDDKAEWKQAIQDGYTGVYRRAVRVNNPQSDVLAVHIRSAEDDDKGSEGEKILFFPLNQQSSK